MVAGFPVLQRQRLNDTDHPGQDSRLIDSVRRGDEASVRQFLERMQCVPRILATRNLRLGRPLGSDDLADLVQDVLVVIWRKLDGFPGYASLESWVYQICVFELMNEIRKRGRHRDLAVEVRRQAASAQESSPWAHEELYRGLETLEPREADIIRLRHFDEKSFQDAAEQLGVPTSTAKSWYYRGLEKLQEFFENRSVEQQVGRSPHQSA